MAHLSLSLPCVPGDSPRLEKGHAWRSRKPHVANPNTDEQAEPGVWTEDAERGLKTSRLLLS